ncbi:MAG: hypothetical protein U0930_03470 [Pirellulales bacterium]
MQSVRRQVPQVSPATINACFLESRFGGLNSVGMYFTKLQVGDVVGNVDIKQRIGMLGNSALIAG